MRWTPCPGCTRTVYCGSIGACAAQFRKDWEDKVMAQIWCQVSETKCVASECKQTGKCRLNEQQPATTHVDPTTVRGQTHGNFINNADIALTLRSVMRSANNWQRLSRSQQLALEEIALKIARITTGDPKFRDSWLDLVGYSKLGMMDCND